MKPLTEQEVTQKMTDFPHWQYSDDALHTSLEFEDFKDAFAMMTRIAFEAETLQHHPDWHNVYNTVNIMLSTHDAGGVTDKDFALASKIDAMIGA